MLLSLGTSVSTPFLVEFGVEVLLLAFPPVGVAFSGAERCSVLFVGGLGVRIPLLACPPAGAASGDDMEASARSFAKLGRRLFFVCPVAGASFSSAGK